MEHKNDITKKIELFFRDLFAKCRKEYSELDVTSFSKEDVEAIFQCFKISACRNFNVDEFVQIDLDFLDKNDFSNNFVEDILSQILSDKSAFPSHKDAYTFSDVNPCFYKIEFIFLTKVKEYFRNLNKKHLPTKNHSFAGFSNQKTADENNHFETCDDIDLADLDYIQDEEYSEPSLKDQEPKTSANSLKKSVSNSEPSPVKQSSVDDDSLRLPNFDMHKLIQAANARNALEQAQQQDEHQLESDDDDSESMEVSCHDDEPKQELPLSDFRKDSITNGSDVNLEPEQNLSQIQMQHQDDILALFECDKISLLKSTPILPEFDEPREIVRDILSRSAVFRPRRKARGPSLINSVNNIPSSEMNIDTAMEKVPENEPIVQEQALDPNAQEEEQSSVSNQTNGSHIQEDIDTSEQTDQKSDNKDDDENCEENGDQILNASSPFHLKIPSVPNVDDRRPKSSKYEDEDSSNISQTAGDIQSSPVSGELSSNGNQLQGGHLSDGDSENEACSLMIVEDYLTVDLKVEDEENEPTENVRTEPIDEEIESYVDALDEPDFECEIKQKVKSLNESDESDCGENHHTKLILKRRHSKTTLPKKTLSENSEPSPENDTNEDDEKIESLKENVKSNESDSVKNDTDDEDGSLIVNNKRRKRKILIDSDEENSKNEALDKEESTDDKDFDNSEEKSQSDDEDDDKKSLKKKKRKRARRLSSASSESKTTSKKKSRKSIRKIIDDDALDEETISAQRAEEEKAKRIAEKQRIYNSVLMTKIKDSSLRKERLILDVSKDEKVLVEVNEHFLQFLKPHQVDGIKFMYDRSIETVEQLKSESSNPSGAILAHSMGLGKTLQTVCFVHTIMTNEHLKDHFKRVLIIAPANVIKNWYEEFFKWINSEMQDIHIWEMSKAKLLKERVKFLQTWFTQGGVLLITINMYSQLVVKTNKKKKNASKDKQEKINPFLEYLAKPGPDLVIIDEGHLLKNDKSQINQAVSKIQTLRRIVLTGTPLQNNLSEYYVMVNFVKPRLLGTKPEFRNRFENPIKHGQHSDSSAADVKVMKKRVHILTRKLKDVIHRCDYRVLVPYLPPKNEYVLKICLTEEQIQLYSSYLSNFTRQEHATLFKDFHALGYIWNHPLLLKNTDSESDLGSDLNDFIDDSSPNSSNNNDYDDDDDEIEFLGSYKPNAKGEEGGSFIPHLNVKKEGSEDAEVKEVKNEFTTKNEWIKKNIIDDINQDVQRKIDRSTKFTLLFEILDRCEVIGDKIIVFSQSLNTLNLIEEFLREQMNNFLSEHPDYVEMSYDQIVIKNNGISHMWLEGHDYLRIDGHSAIDKRMKFIKQFNDPENTRTRLMLVSTKAGGVGINLFGANRCIIFDTSWNPANDLQAIFRIFRYGQVKPVYVYRFVSCGTMEQKIYERQVLKQSLSHRVVDEKQIGRFFKSSDLEELYEFHYNYDEMRRIPKVPSDNLLAEVMSKHKDLIIETLEHDSLLENRPEEELTEEERLQAWDEFHNPTSTDEALNQPLIETPIPSNSNNSLLQNNKFNLQHYNARFQQLMNSRVEQSLLQANHPGSSYSQPQVSIPVGRVVPNPGYGSSLVESQHQNQQSSNNPDPNMTYQNYEQREAQRRYQEQLHLYQQQQQERSRQQRLQREQYYNYNQQQSMPGPSMPNGQTYQRLPQDQSNVISSMVELLDANRLIAYFGRKNDREIESNLFRVFGLERFPDKRVALRTVCQRLIQHVENSIHKIPNPDNTIVPTLYQISHSLKIILKRSQTQPEMIYLD